MFLLILTLLFIFGQVADCQQNATEFCFKCASRRNPKELYADPTDCHYYFQCFYLERKQAVGFRRQCPAGTIWQDTLMQCVPEGDASCTDPCQNPLVAVKNCYASPDGNCAAYYTCSNHVSYRFCCPPGTAINTATCICEWSSTCKDTCSRTLSQPPTSVKPPTVFADHCIDSWGNRMSPAPGNAAAFVASDGSIVKCPAGTSFSLQTCECSNFVPTNAAPTPYNKCYLYLPFDNDALDHSISGAYVDLVGSARQTTAAAARGGGSLIIDSQGSQVEIPYLKNVVFHTYSACAFFRCLTPPCTYSSGGLVSNREEMNSAQLGYVISFQPTNVLRIETVCNVTNTPLAVEVPLAPLPPNAPSGFYQMCTANNGTHQSLYYNNQLVMLVPLDCLEPAIPCPLTIGNDQNYGSFQGYIDEYLECPFDIGQAGVDAHWNGQSQLRALDYLP